MLTALPQRLRHLPREARDTLFLLTVIAWVILPQVANLPAWCSALASAVLLWRGRLAWRGQSLPSSRWLWGLLLLTLGATWFSHRTLLGRDAGVTLIVVLLTLKTLELRARRDAFVVFFLGFFTMLTNFFFSQSLLTAAAMVIALLGLLTALVNAHMPVGKPPLTQAAKVAGQMALLGAPMMAVLFVLFPRLAPLWGIPDDGLTGRSGLSSSMQVGTVASLALDGGIALRVKFEGSPPPQRELYFRGPVLTLFDGREWRAVRTGLAPRQGAALANLRVQGEPIAYQVTLEPTQRPWLLLLDAAATPPDLPDFEVRMTPELLWLADRPLSDRVRYSAQSHPRFTHGPLLEPPFLPDATELPPGSNPRTRQWAAELRADPRFARANTSLLVNVALERLRTGGYTYTLEPGVFGEHTADEFWFDRRQGFCEHIASSFVVLMRALKVPARIVTGFQGGEMNPVDGLWTVRNSDAHAWAEVWVQGQGWVRVDPTTAVAPGRIGSFVRLAAPQGVIASALAGTVGTVSPTLLANLRALWEATNSRWEQWVLNYTQNKQLSLLKDMGFANPSWEDLGRVLLGLMVAVALAGAGWTLWERSRVDPWLHLLAQAHRRLARAGLVLPPTIASTTPPRTLAAQLNTQAAQLGHRLAPIQQWLLQMEALRYGPFDTRLRLATLKRQFKQLPWPK